MTYVLLLALLKLFDAIGANIGGRTRILAEFAQTC